MADVQQLVQDLRTGKVEVVSLPDPEHGPREVLVRTAWSLISPGTEGALTRTAGRSLVGKALDRPDQARKAVDKALRDGVKPAVDAVRARLDELMTPGYSSAGIVEATGADVDGLRPGDRVGCVGANAACHAELAVVPAPLCIPLPTELDLRWGAFGALGAIAAHGLRVAGVAAGEVVAVIGLGLVGQLAAQLATAAGARVVAIDPSAERVRVAVDLGAVAGASPEETDAGRAVLGASAGVGADAVIIAAAASDSEPVRLAARIARDRAVLTVVGDVGLDVPRALLYEKELQLRLSRSYGPGRYDRSYEQDGHDYPVGYVRWTERRLIAYVFDEIAAGRVRLEPLVTHEFPLERGVEAYGALDEPGRLAVLLRHRAERLPPVRRTPIAAPAEEHAPGGVLRLGLIGPGLFARSTLLPLLAKRRVRLVAVAGATAPRAFGVARRAGATWVATDAAEVLGSADVDAVVIATRHDSHATLAADALERGKSVFVEKPLAIDRPGLERIAPLLTSGRLVVDFNRSLSPAALASAAHFSDRTDPLHVHCRVNAGLLPADHWLRDPAVGGGRLVGEGCHFVDLCSALVGAPVATVAAQALGTGPRTLAGDSWVLTLTYTDGSVAVIGYVATGSDRLAKERIEVHGGGRSAVVDDFRGHRLYGGARERLVRPPTAFATRDKGHGATLDAALEFFRSGGEPPIPYARMLETTRVTIAAREAMTGGLRESFGLATF